MITVMFPSGVRVQYNTANYLFRADNSWELKTAAPDKGGEWVASIQMSAGVIVEALPACSVNNPTLALRSSKVDELMAQNWRELAKLKRQIARLAGGANALTREK